MNLTSIFSWLGIALVVVLVGWVASSGRENEELRIERLETAYHIDIPMYAETRCLNKWLLVKIGTHGWVYVRDENFDPVRCDDE